MADRTGAEIVFGHRANAAFPYLGVQDGDRLAVGEVTLRVFETPGHTPEGISILAENDERDRLFTGDTLFVVAAGPTTSIREEPYQADIIERFGIRAVIGKGGMGPKTQKACQEHGCVYLHAIGGAAQIYAESIQRVPSVRLEQFGSPESVWELEVRNFPAVVTIDSYGNNLQQVVADNSQQLLDAVL